MSKTYKISELAKLQGLSRSTLLYYDSIGLLSPGVRSSSGYRLYTDSERQRLAQICSYRANGLSLKDIEHLLNDDADATAIVEKRLSAIENELRQLKLQQRLLAGLLLTLRAGFEASGLENQLWLGLQQACALNEVERWHGQFERSAPQAHHAFLLRLGLSEKEALYVCHISKNTEKDSMQYFYELFQDLPRQGPGCAAATVRALASIRDLPEKPAVLDIGCGSGLPTLILAEQLKTPVTAIDNHRPVLKTLERNAAARGLDISAQAASMFDLPFKPQSFDLIWAEGSIFVIGLERGLSEWRGHLKPGGYLAFTEMCWLEADPPQAIWNYFERVYPAMLSAQNCLSLATEQGYRVVEHFVLPASSWWDDYYTPMLERITDLKLKNAGVPAAQNIYAECELEAEMHRRYKSSYGYVFFVLQA